jgi:dihydropteroate synthase
MTCGIDSTRIILDPGIGFGKELDGECTLIRRCGDFCNGRFPMLMALSRKRCIGEMTGHTDPADRLPGTLAANMLSVLHGASILRVHDVGETADMLKVLEKIDGDRF